MPACIQHQVIANIRTRTCMYFLILYLHSNLIYKHRMHGPYTSTDLKTLYYVYIGEDMYENNSVTDQKRNDQYSSIFSKPSSQLLTSSYKKSPKGYRESVSRLGKVCSEENIKLRSEVAVLKAEVETLRQLLSDTNATLSTWSSTAYAGPPAGPSYKMSGDNGGIQSYITNYDSNPRVDCNSANMQESSSYQNFNCQY